MTKTLQTSKRAHRARAGHRAKGWTPERRARLILVSRHVDRDPGAGVNLRLGLELL